MAIASLYHSCIVTGCGLISDNYFRSAGCIDHLNSAISGNPLYPASKAAFSKSWMCSSAVQSPCIIVQILSNMVARLSVSPNRC